MLVFILIYKKSLDEINEYYQYKYIDMTTQK